MNDQLVAAELAAVLQTRTTLQALDLACCPVLSLSDGVFPRVVCVPKLSAWKGAAKMLRGRFSFRVESLEDQDQVDAHGQRVTALNEILFGAGREQFIADVNARGKVFVHGYTPTDPASAPAGRRRTSMVTVMLGVEVI